MDFKCPECARVLEAPETACGLRMPCPACGQEISVPAPAPPPELKTGSPAPLPAGPVCAICLTPAGPDEATTVCPACQAAYHVECWQQNGGCAAYGCVQTPAVEHRTKVEIPISYWGRENKNCPQCGREILAAAVRCRFCGGTFATARPQDAEQFRQQSELARRLPAARRTIIWLFVLSILPCLAPVGAVWGLIWNPMHREEVRALPTLFGALNRIGLFVAVGQTVAMVVLTVLFLLVRH